MQENEYEKIVKKLENIIEPVLDGDNKYKDLLNLIGNARFVLLGESTHGTKEFYEARIEITKKLILEKNFQALAIEGDWPDAYRVNAYVQNKNNSTDLYEALSGFKRFPRWMWRNKTMLPFLKWLRQYNQDYNYHKLKIGFYGLDLYSMHTAIESVIHYLEKRDPGAAERARERYACFDHTAKQPQNYAYLIQSGVKHDCSKEVLEQLMELQHLNYEYLRKDGLTVEEEHFYATQNARLVKNAEAYYRFLFGSHYASWNLRDEHMAETLEVLANYLESCLNMPAKIIVWAHNSHVGDARATEMHDHGEINLGQLVRERHDSSTFLLGFSTNNGSVTAASRWGDEPIRMEILPALPASYEALFHHLKYKNFLLSLRDNEQLNHFLHYPRLQRAIGVVYRSDTERSSHYYFANLPLQFDALIHLDVTSALEPLD